MAAMTVTTKLNDLKVLFNRMKEIYYKSAPIAVADIATTIIVDMELPVLEDGVTIDTGQADVTNINITTGAIWTTRAVKGDPDISFQVASVAGAVNALLLNKVEDITASTSFDATETYKGAAYSLAPKKTTGALIMMSEDRQTILILPSVEMYSSFVAADGDNPAYFNVAVTPVENEDGSDIFILERVDE